MALRHYDPRQLVAEEAARLIYEEGFRDYRLAKQKAIMRMGLSNQGKNQPSNDEVETALHAYIELLNVDDEQAHILEKHRRIACEAMEFLELFRPFLTGSALEGTSGPHSAVTLHLTASSAEEVIFFLDDHKIPFTTHERKIRFGKHQAYYPLLRFYANNVEVELLLLPDEGNHLSKPISPITGKGVKRVSYRKLLSLMEEKTDILLKSELQTHEPRPPIPLHALD